jgi:GntR family transcriptional regulator, galactonate operon transcriptional repressor
MSAYPSRGAHGRAVQVVAQRVVSGEYPPGVLLDPELLQRELDVSRTVIREMLRVLAAKGMVAARPRHGTVVLPRSAWSLLDPDLLRWLADARGGDSAFLGQLAEVRAIIEPAGARLAALRHTTADLAELRAAIEEMAEAGPAGPAAVESDLRFHRALLAAAHNDLMLPMEAIIETGMRARDLLVHEGSCADAVPSHRKVVEAVAARDGDAAESATRELLEQADRDVQEALYRRSAAAVSGQDPA